MVQGGVCGCLPLSQSVQPAGNGGNEGEGSTALPSADMGATSGVCLSVCCGGHRGGHALSKQRLSNWKVEASASHKAISAKK